MKLQIKDYSVYSSEGVRLVEKASFCLETGKVYLLKGKNGAGKSSLVLGLLKYPKLRVSGPLYDLDGYSLLEASTEDIARRGVFLANQHVPEVPGVGVIQVLHAAHIGSGGTADILSFKDNLEQILTKIGIDIRFLERDLFAGFSGGEKKMLQCIFAIALTPKFVLFDEIDSGVDVASLQLVYATVAYLKAQGTGVLMISHQPQIESSLEVEYTFEFGGHTIKNPNC